MKENLVQRFLSNIDSEIARLQGARSAIASLLRDGHITTVPIGEVRRKSSHRRMSAAGRRAISIAQKKRWAKKQRG